MKIEWIASLVVGAAVFCRTEEANADPPVPIGQPTVFWHNGEWQTYKDGVWSPYHDENRRVEAPAATEPAPEMAPEQGDAPEEPIMYPYYGGGIVNSGRFHRRHRHRPRPTPYAQVPDPSGLPTVGIGQTTIGIGPQQPGLGQTTIGMGPQQPGLGQTTIGIGPQQPGIGQTTIGMGPQQPGLGQTTIGIGPQPPGIGQTTIGVGPQQPGIGQTTIGIGQPNTTSAGKASTKPSNSGAGKPRAGSGQTPMGAGRPAQGGRSSP